MKNQQQSSDKPLKTPSPCVRNCCLNENDICLGCFRHLDEITGWAAMTEQEKQVVLAKCAQRKKGQ